VEESEKNLIIFDDGEHYIHGYIQNEIMSDMGCCWIDDEEELTKRICNSKYCVIYNEQNGVWKEVERRYK